MMIIMIMMLITSLLVYLTSIKTVLSYSSFKSTPLLNVYFYSRHNRYHYHRYHQLKRLQVHTITSTEPAQPLSTPSTNVTLMSNSTPNHNHQQQQQKQQYIRNNDTNNIRDLCVPLLDYKLIEDTIRQWTRPLPTSYLSKPLVLVGPSGVGKGRLVRAILKDYSRFFQKVVTHTTRNPRPDEVNGTSYHFVTNDTFHLLNSSGNNYFIESAKVHNNYYGTSLRAWQAVLQLHKIPIMEIDIQGAKSIKKSVKKYSIFPWFVFIAPPAIDALMDRLNVRNTESDEEIQLRMYNAKMELDEANQLKHKLFHYILVNDDFQNTTNLMFRLIRDEYPSIPSASRIRMLQRRIKKVKEIAIANSKQGGIVAKMDQSVEKDHDNGNHDNNDEEETANES